MGVGVGVGVGVGASTGIGVGIGIGIIVGSGDCDNGLPDAMTPEVSSAHAFINKIRQSRTHAERDLYFSGLFIMSFSVRNLLLQERTDYSRVLEVPIFTHHSIGKQRCRTTFDDFWVSPPFRIF